MSSSYCTYHHGNMSLEAISKPQMRFEGKAKADEKREHTREYVSILKRLSTRPSSVRWGFETASIHICSNGNPYFKSQVVFVEMYAHQVRKDFKTFGFSGRQLLSTLLSKHSLRFTMILR